MSRILDEHSIEISLPNKIGYERIAMECAASYLNGQMGDNVDDWKWGELHTLTFYHPFGKSSSLVGYFMNIGPFPMGGSIATVNPQPYRLSKPWVGYHGASLRYIIDFSNMKNSLRVIPAGISGNFMSPHYDDQVELWRTGKYRPFVLDRKSVEEDARYTLIMLPAPFRLYNSHKS